MFSEEIIESLCAFSTNNGYAHIHGSFAAIDYDGNSVGEIDMVIASNGKYCISHLYEPDDSLRVRFRDSSSQGYQLAMMGSAVSLEDRSKVVREIIDRVLA